MTTNFITYTFNAYLEWLQIFIVYTYIDFLFLEEGLAI